jgi:hypothetical protein
MSALGIASIVFVCIFCSGLLGLFLRTVVPKHHLGEDSRGVVKLGSELLATFAAVVLGLLIASAKDSYDKTNDEVTQTPTKVAQFDRDLIHYGPETKETRNLLHDVFAFAIEPTFSEKGSEEKLNNPDR